MDGVEEILQARFGTDVGRDDEHEYPPPGNGVGDGSTERHADKQGDQEHSKSKPRRSRFDMEAHELVVRPLEGAVALQETLNVGIDRCT